MQITFTLVLCAFLFFITHAGYLCDEQKKQMQNKRMGNENIKIKECDISIHD